MTKKALCMSETSPEKHLRQLHNSTIAIAFLGTPHRGSGMATYAEAVVRFLKHVRKRVNQDIVETLKQNSSILNDVENAFDRWVRNKAADIDITCFYEELELPIVGVVSIESFLSTEYMISDRPLAPVLTSPNIDVF